MTPSDRPPAFRYRLAALLRRHAWERDELRAEALHARRLADEKDRLHRAGTDRVTQAQDSMRDLHRHDATISLETRRMAQLYLAQAYEARARLDAEAQAARRMLDDTLVRLDAKRIAVKTLETHRERQRKEREADQARAVQRTSDELWLLRRR